MSIIKKDKNDMEYADPVETIHWLKGVIAISPQPPEASQWEIIKQHINAAYNDKHKKLGSGGVISA